MCILALKLARNGIPYLKRGDIDTGGKLGGGSFGIAKKCLILGKEYVLKEFKNDYNVNIKGESVGFNISSVIDSVDGTSTEFLAAKMGTHPNVISLYGFTLDKFGIIMELAECGDLSSYIKKNFETLDLTKMYRIAAGIANGLEWLTNASGVVHRDLKPENILLDGTLTPKVSDFGIVRILEDPNDVEFECDGNLLYSPPEIIDKAIAYIDGSWSTTGTTDKTSVVYAYGLILFFIMTGKEPYLETDGVGSIPALKKKICNPTYPANVVVPEGFKGLISACISRDMASRPSFTDIRDLLWLAYLDAEIPLKVQEEPHGFWNAKFRGKVEVPFDEITSGSYDEKAKDILCGGRTRTITPSRFSLLYRAFGAWYDCTSPSFKKTLSLISQDWFMEDQGPTALSNYPDGTFYVRIASASSPASFTLEVSNNGKNKKVKISTKIVDKRKVFFLDGVSEAFSSVGSIIDYLKGKGIINDVYRPQKSSY